MFKTNIVVSFVELFHFVTLLNNCITYDISKKHGLLTDKCPTAHQKRKKIYLHAMYRMKQRVGVYYSEYWH